MRRVFFSNADRPWMAGVLRQDDGAEVSFAGKVAAQPGDKLELSGRWTVHPKFGRQFEAETGTVRMDESPDALAHLLASHPDFRGIGPARANKIVDAALALSEDGDISSALERYPDEIAERAKVPLEPVMQARKVWLERRGHFSALAALTKQGWSASQATAIVKVFGENAASIVSSDPYTLIGKVPRFGFRTVDAVARANGTDVNAPDRMIAGVAYCLDRIGDDGHTWTNRDDLLHEAAQELRPDTLEGEARIVTALDTLIAEGAVHVDRSPQGTEIVASAALAKVEWYVFDVLLQGLREECPRALDFTLPEAQEAILPLNDGQRAAIEGLGRFRFGVLAGGAGVGKTFAMHAACAVAEANGLTVELCAPTGKAARKLARSTGRDAQTIHRLLEPQFDELTGEFRFTRHGGNPLEADLVIVDEVSMVDVRLMRSLLLALPEHARLLVVGDHHQIPSVGPGAILRDILSAREHLSGSVHILGEVVRQAGVLARNTSALLDGVVDSRTSPVWAVQATERGNEEGAAGIAAMLVEAIVTTPAPEPFGRTLDLAWDVQVLAPMRKGPLGTYALNARLQALRQRLLGNALPPPVEDGKPPKPLVGDRVIWTKNDYALGLTNGTQALVQRIHKSGPMDLLIEDGREVTISAADRTNVEVAWAMTIHKSQGSEWPCVVLAISSTHFIMRDRNLLYTGASRAAESLTILGDLNGIRSFASFRRSARRQTFGSYLVRGWKPCENVIA